MLGLSLDPFPEDRLAPVSVLLPWRIGVRDPPKSCRTGFDSFGTRQNRSSAPSMKVELTAASSVSLFESSSYHMVTSHQHEGAEGATLTSTSITPIHCMYQ